MGWGRNVTCSTVLPRLPLVESAIIGGFLHFWGCNRVIWNTSVALFACDAGFTNCRGTPGFPKKTSAGRWEGPLSGHKRRSLFVCLLNAARNQSRRFHRHHRGVVRLRDLRPSALMPFGRPRMHCLRPAGKSEKPSDNSTKKSAGGGGRTRTCEGIASGFTVRPLCRSGHSPEAVAPH